MIHGQREIVPFGIKFGLPRNEVAVPKIPYSDKTQRGLSDPEQIKNPLYMSPTNIGTSGGDDIGDEAH